MSNARRTHTRPRTTRNPRIGLLRVGETARILGVSPSTLRVWESVGLVRPARSNGRFRLYSPELLTILKRIKYLRDVKLLNLPGIQQAMAKRGNGQSQSNGNDGSAVARGQYTRDLGPKLRQLRKRQGLGIVAAAKRARITAGFLSAIELSRANPSVATLQRLAAAYGTTVMEFYDLPRHPGRLVRPRQRRVIQTESGVRIELLSAGAKQLESHMFRVAPGAGSGGSYSHEGEEFIYVVAGSLELWLDELECHTLHEGDSIWFESTMGHRWHNSSTTEAVLLWINTPATF